MDKNSQRWYVFELADKTELQSAAGSTAGLQTLKSFTWQINHYQLSSHIEIGGIYGETASGVKVRLFDPATAEIKNSDDNAAGGNYIFKSGNQASCFTVSRKTNKYNFDTTAAAAGWKEITLPIANLPSDMSAYNGISFDVDNSENEKAVFFNKYFTEKTANKDSKKEAWYDNGNLAFVYDESGALLSSESMPKRSRRV